MNGESLGYRIGTAIRICLEYSIGICLYGIVCGGLLTLLFWLLLSLGWDPDWGWQGKP